MRNQTKKDSSTDLITPAMLYGRKLTLQQTNAKVRVSGHYSSTLIGITGFLVQGETGNPNPESRNAVITFTNPVGAEIVGKNFGFFTVNTCCLKVMIILYFLLNQNYQNNGEICL